VQTKTPQKATGRASPSLDRPPLETVIPPCPYPPKVSADLLTAAVLLS